MELSGVQLPFTQTPGFTEWAQSLIATRTQSTTQKPEERLFAGSQALAQSGVTTTFDIESTPGLWDACDPTALPLRVLPFPETTGALSGAPPETLLSEILDRQATLRKRFDLSGISPHAPYSTSVPLLRQIASLEPRVLATMHVAESEDEWEYLTRGTGPMAEWLVPRIRIPAPEKETPLRHVARTGLLTPRLLVVHANTLDDRDVRILAESKATVVHCPRTHAYFNRPPFHYRRLRDSGTAIVLGTDSTSSIGPPSGSKAHELSLTKEMKNFATQFPHVPSREILEMVTTGPARMIPEWKIGALVPGYRADMTVFDFSGPTAEAEDYIVRAAPSARSTWIDGRASRLHPSF